MSSPVQIAEGLIRFWDYGNGHAHLELDNPPVNALSVDLVDELHNVLSSDLYCKNKKFKVLTIGGGADKHFSAGADLKERASMSDAETLQFINKLNDCFDLIENLEIPTIACVHGAVLGGGAELALCCDIIYADVGHNSEDFRIGFPETSIGIIPGAGGTYRLYKKMNVGVAKYWVLSGKVFSFKEACKYGVVDISNDELTQTGDCRYTELLESLINNSRTSLVAAKASMNKCYIEQDRKKQRLIELEEYKKTLDSPERKETLKKYKKK